MKTESCSGSMVWLNGSILVSVRVTPRWVDP